MNDQNFCNELESFLKNVYGYFHNCLENDKKPKRKDILQKNYLNFLWQMNSLINKGSKEIKKTYKILEVTLIKFLDEAYISKIEKINNEEEENKDKKKEFLINFNLIVENYLELIIVISRIFVYSDKEQTQVANFLDQTSENLCKKLFQKNIINKYEIQITQIFKVFISRNYFLAEYSKQNELNIYLKNILFFFDRTKISSERFLRRLIETFIEVLKIEFSKIVQMSSEISKMESLKALFKFTEITHKNLEYFLPKNFFDDFKISLDKFYEITVSHFTKDLISIPNKDIFYKMLKENDFKNLKRISELLQYDKEDSKFLKEPIINFLEREGILIIDEFIDKENCRIIEAIHELIDKISIIVNNCFNKNSQLLFAKTKGIEKFINLKKKNKKGRYSQDIILEKLIDYTISIIIKNSEDISESQKNYKIHIIIEILSFLNTKIFFEKISKFLTEKIINDRYLKNSKFEKELIKKFSQKFGDDYLNSLNRILYNLELSEKKNDIFNKFKKLSLVKKKNLEINRSIISQQDITTFASLKSSTQFKFLEQIIETFFYRDIKNEKKKIIFHFELGRAELEIDYKGCKTMVISQPIVILIILNVGYKKKSSKEIFLDLIKKIPKGKEEFYEKLIHIILKKLLLSKIFCFENERYFFNPNFRCDENKILIDLNIFKIFSALISQNERKEERKFELESKIMRGIKYDKRLFYKDFLTMFKIEIDKEVLNKTLNKLIEKDLIKRSPNDPNEFLYSN